MTRLLALGFAALALSAVPFGGPSFRSYTVPLGAPAQGLLVAPLDADATADVALLLGTNSADASLLTLRGLGDGRLEMEALQTLSAFGYVTVPRLAAADLNQDDILDLGISGVIEQVNLGDGDLSYVSSQLFPTLGGFQFDVGFTDLDGDGDLDSKLLVDDLGGLFLDHGVNDGNGVLGAGAFDSAPGIPIPHARAHFADLDGDGADENIVTSSTGLGISSSTVATNISVVAGLFPEVLSAHFNADDFLDIALAAPDESGLLVLLNDGAAGFPQATLVKTFGRPDCLAAGDVTGNGHVDLVAANRGSGSLAVMENDGTGVFTRVARLAVGADPIAVELADLDADGDLDVLVASSASAELTVLLNQLIP